MEIAGEETKHLQEQVQQPQERRFLDAEVQQSQERKYLDEYVNNQSVTSPRGNCWGRNKTFAGTSSTITRKKIFGLIR